MSNVPPPPVDQELIEALRELQGGGKPVTVASIPAHTRKLPMAHVTEHPLRAVEAALAEAASRAPGWAALAVSLASPAVLCVKGFVDLVKGVKMVGEQRVIDDPPAMLIALAAFAVGAGAFGLLLQKWIGDHKPSKLQELANRHVAECFTEMNLSLETPEKDQVAAPATR